MATGGGPIENPCDAHQRKEGAVMKQFSAGLIGAGYISEYHVAALRRLPDVEIVGVTDLDHSKSAALAERFGLRSFSSSAALADAGANVMHVLTPPESHALVTLDALDRGCHVLVEKPLAVDVD